MRRKDGLCHAGIGASYFLNVSAGPEEVNGKDATHRSRRDEKGGFAEK
jgi:hypothetical protein